MKIIPVVGKSDSGKTTFLEKLIPLLKRKGYRVAVIKHDTHGFDIDHEGKDTYRIKEAGADAVIISSPKKMSLIKDVEEEIALGALARDFFGEYDIIFTEGYKNSPLAKIEVFRSEVNDKPLCSPAELILLATDKKLDFKATQFGINDVEVIANYLAGNHLGKPKKIIKAKLTVNNKKVPLKDFVQDMFAHTLAGMLTSLKDIEKPEKIILEINLNKKQ